MLAIETAPLSAKEAPVGTKSAGFTGAPAPITKGIFSVKEAASLPAIKDLYEPQLVLKAPSFTPTTVAALFA